MARAKPRSSYLIILLPAGLLQEARCNRRSFEIFYNSLTLYVSMASC
jgi:hypothetical protein